MIAMNELKSSEYNLYTFIVKFKREHDGNSPTYRQMASAIGKKSTSYVSFLLEGLRKKGYIKPATSENENRLVEVVGGRWFCIAEENGVEDG